MSTVTKLPIHFEVYDESEENDIGSVIEGLKERKLFSVAAALAMYGFRVDPKDAGVVTLVSEDQISEIEGFLSEVATSYRMQIGDSMFLKIETQEEKDEKAETKRLEEEEKDMRMQILMENAYISEKTRLEEMMKAKRLEM